MPHFEVQITRNVIHLTTLTVEADDEDSAEKAALERVEDPETKGLEWEFEDETFEIENVDETDPPEDEEEPEDDEDEDESKEDEEDTAAQ